MGNKQQCSHWGLASHAVIVWKADAEQGMGDARELCRQIHPAAGSLSSAICRWIALYKLLYFPVHLLPHLYNEESFYLAGLIRALMR